MMNPAMSEPKESALVLKGQRFLFHPASVLISCAAVFLSFLAVSKLVLALYFSANICMRGGKGARIRGRGVSREGNFLPERYSDEGSDDRIIRSAVETKFRVLGGLPDGGATSSVERRRGLPGMGDIIWGKGLTGRIRTIQRGRESGRFRVSYRNVRSILSGLRSASTSAY